MPSISIPDLLTIIYVLVDDWYQARGAKLLQGKAGKSRLFETAKSSRWFWLKTTFRIHPKRSTLNSFEPTISLCFLNCWIRANSIGERVACDCSSKNCVGIGFCTSITICAPTTCWIPNRFLFLDTNGANHPVILPEAPIMGIAPAVS